jgi:hypothetical protein
MVSALHEEFKDIYKNCVVHVSQHAEHDAASQDVSLRARCGHFMKNCLVQLLAYLFDLNQKGVKTAAVVGCHGFHEMVEITGPEGKAIDNGSCTRPSDASAGIAEANARAQSSSLEAGTTKWIGDMSGWIQGRRERTYIRSLAC